MRDGTETKERIERAAIRMFVKHGVNGASIREIAREAGVSQGAMYNHYTSKEDLAWALFSRSWSDIAVEMRQRMHGEPTLLAKLRALTNCVFRRFEEDWELVTYVYFSRHENIRRVTASLPNPHLVVRLAIVDGMARGEIPRQNAEVATAMVMGILIQIIDTKALGRIKPDLTKLADSVAEACFRALMG
ncbi:MAG TPA: TetR/AcrR family transcriptional regulator [Alphaproteobacteria bacterium]|nr:TetR/AcrR family transcriptional regulator [Alphaproteobacteria bacterium]